MLFLIFLFFRFIFSVLSARSSYGSSSINLTSLTYVPEPLYHQQNFMTAKPAPSVNHYFCSHEKYSLNCDLLPVRIDKSLMIKELLENDKKVILINRPRNCGKSLNINMFREFFQIETNKEGFPAPAELRAKHQVFRSLKIAQHSHIISAYLGKFPVVYINFGTLNENNVNGVANKMGDTFFEYPYLRKYTSHTHFHFLSAVERIQLSRHLAGSNNEDYLAHSLALLVKLLFVHFQQKVFVFIDEQDTPIYEVFEEFGPDSDELNSMVQLFRDMYRNTFENNPHLEKVVMTGIVRLAQCNLFPNLSEFAEYTILDQHFSSFYGFTSEEVDEVLKNWPTKVNPNRIKSWYNGYNYGGKVVYNSCSMSRCLDDERLHHYWLESGSVSAYESILLSDPVRGDLNRLMRGKSIVMELRTDVSLSMNELKVDRGKFWNLMAFSGYVNVIPVGHSGSYHLVIPNRELEQVYICIERTESH